MKRLSLLSGISILLLFGSCASSQPKDSAVKKDKVVGKESVVKIVFDDSVPPEKSSWINVGNVGRNDIVTVAAYNSISVSDWKTLYPEMIQIPAGATEIEMDIEHIIRNILLTIKLTAKNMIFKYNFQPQKQYYITLVGSLNDELDIEGEYGVNIYEWNFGERIPENFEYKNIKNHFTAFVPFLNKPVFTAK